MNSQFPWEGGRCGLRSWARGPGSPASPARGSCPPASCSPAFEILLVSVYSPPPLGLCKVLRLLFVILWPSVSQSNDGLVCLKCIAQSWLGVKLELHLLAAATATQDPSEPRLQATPQLTQCWILNPMSKARDGTLNLMITSQIRFCCITTGTPLSNSPFLFASFPFFLGLLLIW